MDLEMKYLRNDTAGDPNHHEVSSLQGAHPLAPSPTAAEHELMDREALEVPLGHSSDKAYDFELNHEQIEFPETTGTVLLTDLAKPPLGMHETSLINGVDSDAVTVRATTGEIRTANDKYDAVDAEDLGTEWLSRATTGTRDMDQNDDMDRFMEHVDAASVRGGLSSISEASYTSALGADEQEDNN